DLRDAPAAGRLAAALTRMGAELGDNVDLDGGLLLRAVLVRLDQEEYLLGLAADHLVVDGEAFEILARELWNGYTAALAGEPPAAPPAFAYSEFVRWEANWLAQDPEPRRITAEVAQHLRG